MMSGNPHCWTNNMINRGNKAWPKGYRAFRGVRFFFLSLLLSFCSFFLTLVFLFSRAGPFF
jgi:hypothetical protein